MHECWRASHDMHSKQSSHGCTSVGELSMTYIANRVVMDACALDLESSGTKIAMN